MGLDVPFFNGTSRKEKAIKELLTDTGKQITEMSNELQAKIPPEVNYPLLAEVRGGEIKYKSI